MEAELGIGGADQVRLHIRQLLQARVEMLLGQHRFGVTDGLTAGFRLEGDQDRVSGGPGLAVRLRAGEIDAELGISNERGELGYAGAAAYRYNGRPFNFNLYDAYGRTTYLRYTQAF